MSMQIASSLAALARRRALKTMKLGDRAALVVSLVLIVYVVVTLSGIVRQAWQLYGDDAPAVVRVVR